MKFSRFELETIDIKPLANAISSQMDRSYVNETDEMIIIASETYKLRTNSTQMNMVIVKKVNSKSYVDIIGAAGGTGILNISLWAESGFVRSTLKQLEEYCSLHGIRYTKQEMKGY
ncbi:DUF6054 family protein [Dokdonia sp.]|uniref:DUF6054 family protein n=1 Tax=Dokdonia sp. TaxID=2024995 RepID=UPI003266BAC2